MSYWWCKRKKERRRNTLGPNWSSDNSPIVKIPKAPGVAGWFLGITYSFPDITRGFLEIKEPDSDIAMNLVANMSQVNLDIILIHIHDEDTRRAWDALLDLSGALGGLDPGFYRRLPSQLRILLLDVAIHGRQWKVGGPLWEQEDKWSNKHWKWRKILLGWIKKMLFKLPIGVIRIPNESFCC